MEELTHWTDESIDAFIYQLSSSFVRQLELCVSSQKDLAAALHVSPPRVSQMFNNPGNLTLKRCVKYARALGKKVALVAYDDGDPANMNGPVDGQVFERCWLMTGRPTDFFAVDDAASIRTFIITPGGSLAFAGALKIMSTQTNSAAAGPGYTSEAGNNTTLLTSGGASNHGRSDSDRL